MYGHDLGHSFASAPGCTTLSPTTAPSIVPRWGYLTPDSLTASPTVVDGVAYAGDWSGRFYAIPVDQGSVAAKPRWTFQVDDPSQRRLRPDRVDGVGGLDRRDRRRGVRRRRDAVRARRRRRPASSPGCASTPEPTRRCAAREAADGAQVEVESSPAVDPRRTAARRSSSGSTSTTTATSAAPGSCRAGSATGGATWTLEPTWKFDPEGGTDGATYRGPGLLTGGSGTGFGCAQRVGLARRSTSRTTSCSSAPGRAAPTASRSARTPSPSTCAPASSCGASTRRGVNEDWDDDYGASPNLLPGGRVGFGSKDGSYYALDRHARRAWRGSPASGRPATSPTASRSAASSARPPSAR